MTLDENDYLTFQLYTASKTPRIRRGRIQGWIITTAAFLCLAHLLYNRVDSFLGYLFLVLAGLSLAFYPFYSRWRYRQHYRKYSRDTYKDRFGVEVNLDINETTIVATDKTGEVKINTSEIEAIDEIKEHYFIRVRGGTCVIISKIKADDPENISNAIKSLAENKKIKYNKDLNWKWR